MYILTSWHCFWPFTTVFGALLQFLASLPLVWHNNIFTALPKNFGHSDTFKLYLHIHTTLHLTFCFFGIYLSPQSLITFDHSLKPLWSKLWTYFIFVWTFGILSCLIQHAPTKSPVIITHSSTPFQLWLHFIPLSTMNSTSTLMPAQGDWIAPQFDPKHPHQLHCYFADFDFLFWWSSTSDNQEWKCHACHYVDFITSELWESLTEFSYHNQSFAEFEPAVFGLYPELVEECRWLVVDLDILGEERYWTGVSSIGDLGKYYWQFILIICHPSSEPAATLFTQVWHCRSIST